MALMVGTRRKWGVYGNYTVISWRCECGKPMSIAVDKKPFHRMKSCPVCGNKHHAYYSDYSGIVDVQVISLTRLGEKIEHPLR